MSARYFEAEEVLSDLKQIVADCPPGYKDPNASDGSCSYADPETGNPACIVGQWLYRQGVSSEDLLALDEHNSQIYSHYRKGRIERLGISLSETALTLLDRVQTCQDNGSTWEDAVAYGERMLRDDEVYA